MKAKAYIVHQAMCEPELKWSKPKDCLSAEPLYSNRKPLTDEEIEDIVIEMNGNEPPGQFWRDLTRAIEAAHGIKEKNT